MPIILGGPTAWKVRRHGDVTIAFHWINDEPAMVLYPSYRRMGVTPFAIPLESAFDYAEDMHLVEKSTLACDLMGFGTDKSMVMRLARLINDSLPDLLHMPPAKIERPRETQGELVVKMDGQTILEEAV
jgi:hypothetical protein